MRTSRPCPPGNSVAKTPSNSRCDVGERGGEDVVDALVDLADDGEQVAAGGLEVLELGGQEAVPLLQRRELLQRQRVDLAEGGEVALGPGGPALLDGAVVGHRVGLGLPRRLGRGDLLPGSAAPGAAGPYSASSVGRSTPYSSAARASSASIR